jgi:hypothetical protein
VSARAHERWLDLVITDGKLSMGARVAARIVTRNVHMARGPGARPTLKGFAWEREDKMAARMNVSERQVRRYVRELEDLGYLRVTPKKVGLANGLELMWPAIPTISRPQMSGQIRPGSRRARDAGTGQFVQPQPATTVRPGRTLVACDSPEDHPDDLRARRLPGVSETTMAAYSEALMGGDVERARQALLGVMAEHEASKVRSRGR